MDEQRIKEITNYIFLDSQPQKADLVLIFGTRHFQKPTRKAFGLYRNNLVPKIFLSGGINEATGKVEADRMAQELMNLGVKKENILIENKSTNTLENVLFSRKMIEENMGIKNVKKIIIIVKHYHARRALMTLKKHFPESIEIEVVSYDIHGFAKDNWFKYKKGRELVYGELDKIKKYLAKGDIKEL